MRFDTDGLSRDRLSQMSDLARDVIPGEAEDCANRVIPLFPFGTNAFEEWKRELTRSKPAPKSHKIVIWSLLTLASLVTWYCGVNYGVLK